MSSVFSRLMLTRRALAGQFAMGVAAVGIGGQASAAPAINPHLRDAALRGLALAGYRGDPVAAAAAEESLSLLAATDPEGALLCRLYRVLDVRPAAYYRADMPAASAVALEVLHDAIHACRPVAFDYTDLEGEISSRTVLPLALVHPPQGVKLLAWCQKAEGYRQFFVRMIQGATPQMGDFTPNRMALLEGLVEKHGA